LVERLGVKVALVEGEEHNIKVTTSVDMRVAEALFT
jgi:2-C-methyl-D-erythritol 4-phosphate cytidylyltransferase